MVQFNILDQPGVQKMLAAKGLSLLMRFATYAVAGQTEWDPAQFTRGQSITLSKSKRSTEADDFDPYLGVDAPSDQPGNSNITLTLERLFTKGFPIFSQDSSIDRYVAEYSMSNADAIARSVEDYMYSKTFIDFSGVPSTGTVDYTGGPPLGIVWIEDISGNLLPTTRTHLIRSEAALDTLDVPRGVQNRFAIIKPYSYSDLFENAPTDEGRAGSIAQGTDILANGLPFGSFIDRYGLMVGKSNAVLSQTAVADISGGNPAVGITTAADDTTVFFDGNIQGNPPLGAVQLTLDAALTGGNLAVGDIIRIGASGSTAAAWGRVLRIDPSLTDIWVVPYGERAEKLVAAQIPTGANLVTAPEIASLNTVHHRELLAYAFRALARPSDGSGAVMTDAVDAMNAIVYQVLRGDYRVDRFQESARTAVLCGAIPTDYRKGLMLISS